MQPLGIRRHGDSGFTLASSSQDFTPFPNRDNQRIRRAHARGQMYTKPGTHTK